MSDLIVVIKQNLIIDFKIRVWSEADCELLFFRFVLSAERRKRLKS